MHPLAGPREKLGRAQKHALKLETKIEEFFRDNRHRIVIAEKEPGGEYYALRARVPKPPPLEWGAVIGEIAHDLRSALDGLLWQAIILNGVDPNRLSRPKPEFPIYLRGEGRKGPTFKRDGLPKIRARVSATSAAIIDGLQPYHRRNKGRLSTLWALQELNNADKHRMLQLAAAHTGGPFGDFMFDGPAPPGLSYADVRSGIKYRSGTFLIDGAKLGVIHRSVAEKMNVNLLPITHISFWKGCDAVQGMPVLSLIRLMGSHASQVLFSYFAPVFAPFPDEWSVS